MSAPNRFFVRLGVLSCAVVVMVLSVAAPASAIIPTYDAANWINAVMRYRQLFQQGRGQIRQIEYAFDQARHLRDQAQGWRNFRLSDFGGILRQANRTMGSGVSLGYGNPQLAELFRRQFPRVPSISNGMRIPHAEQLNSVRDLAFAAVMSSQMQGGQIDLAQQALDALRRSVVTAGTERQLQQAEVAVQAFQAEQDLLTRHTMLSLNQQLAASNARDAQRQMEEGVQAAEADRRWQAWEQAVAGQYGSNLEARDRAAGAIRRRAGVRGTPAPARERRDPRDVQTGERSSAAQRGEWR